MTRLMGARGGDSLRLIRVCVCWACVFSGWAAWTASGQERSITPLNIRPEPLSITPGKPLSVRSLVSHPIPLNDALSWTIESRRHRGLIYSFAVSPDGKQLASGGLDGTIRIWDAASGELVRVMVGHDQVVYGLAWSPDGSVLASAGGWDYTVRLWDTRRGMPLRVFRGLKSYVYHIAWSYDGSRLAAAGGHSGWAWVWKGGADDGEVLAEVGQDVRSIHWSPSGQYVAISVTEGAVTLLDVSLGKPTTTLGEASDNLINYVVRWSPDGAKLLVGNAVQAILYDMPDGKPGQKIAGLCYSAAWSPDGKRICTANSGGGVKITDAETGKVVTTFVTGAAEHAWPTADLLAAKSTSALSTWDPTTGKQIRNFPITHRTPPVWSPGRPIVTGIGTNQLTLWDSTTAKSLKTLEGQTAPITTVAWTRDGKTLASASHDTTINLWQTASGKLLHTLKEHKSPVLCLAWSPDGKLLASGGGSPAPSSATGPPSDNDVRLWQLSGAKAGVLAGHTQPVNALAWVPRGNLLASGSTDTTVRFWHPDRGDFLRDLKGPRPILALAFSPDGTKLAAGSTDEVVRLWQTSNGSQINQHITSPGSPPTVTAVSWSPDGQGLFVGRGNHTAQLWNWVEPKIIHNLQAMAPVDSVNVTASGYLLTGGQDATLRFWDAESGELRGVILDLEGGPLLLSTDGHYRFDATKQPNVVIVVQTPTDQLLLTAAEFGKKYRWKNLANSVKFTGK